MDSSPLSLLPLDTLHNIFTHLSLRQIAASRCVCKSLSAALSSPAFLNLISDQSLSLLALKPFDGHHLSPDPTLHAFDLSQNQWLRFSLSFLPFCSLYPITASGGLLYLWASESPPSLLNSDNSRVPNSQKALVVCNPLTRQFKTLPQLGSAWSRHGSVLAGSSNVVIVLTELAILDYCPGNNRPNNKVTNNNNVVNNNWLKFSSNLPSKSRSPILVSDFILTLCDVGTPWRSQWALFKMKISDMEKTKEWDRLEKLEWADVLDILKRPRLVKAGNDKKVYMVGGLKNSQALQSLCITVLILKLDLERMEWDEAGRMPMEMYRYFMEGTKFKVFGGGNRICFSAKKLSRLAIWEEYEEGRSEWRWIEGVYGDDDGPCRGFVFDAMV